MHYIEIMNRIVCGVPALVMILGVGIYLSVCTKFAQIRFLPKALRVFIGNIVGSEDAKNGTSSYQAFCTALAATVGTGNLAGVAGAITLGGPGAVFWMWICGILGMVTKFAEATLAICFRSKNKNGEYVGGPMYMIEKGLHGKYRILAVLYCVLGSVAAFGVGNTAQINAVIDGVNSAFATYGTTAPRWLNILLGILLATLIGAMLMGGMKRIGAITERLVPVASLFYIVLCIGVLIICRHRLVGSLIAIFQGAFSPKAVTGGTIGSALISLRVGAARGVFTNEAGLGTASIAHATSNAKFPVEQGFMGIMEVFVDTIVICTMTALAILSSGIGLPYGCDIGASVTTEAFVNVYGNWVSIPLAVALCLFAIASILGWGLYGGRCFQYLFGEDVWKLFVSFQVVFVIIGSCLKTETVWLFAETVNCLMTIPNLVTLVLLCPKLLTVIKEYELERNVPAVMKRAHKSTFIFHFPKGE